MNHPDDKNNSPEYKRFRAASLKLSQSLTSLVTFMREMADVPVHAAVFDTSVPGSPLTFDRETMAVDQHRIATRRGNVRLDFEVYIAVCSSLAWYTTASHALKELRDFRLGLLDAGGLGILADQYADLAAVT